MLTAAWRLSWPTDRRAGARLMRDYIVAHYKLNTRDDSDYWRANRENEALSPALEQILETWFRRADLVALLNEQRGLSHFGSASWHCLLAGYGAFPDLTTQQRGDVDFHRDRDIARLLGGCALNFDDHAAVLARMRQTGDGN